jgi:hypothetical protein
MTPTPSILPSRTGQAHMKNRPSEQKSNERLPIVGRHTGWNEVHFVTIGEFRNNAPAVIGLEINRLTDVLGGLDPGSAVYNEVVGARHLLRIATVEIQESTNSRLTSEVTTAIESAVLRLAVEFESCDAVVAGHLEYTMNRLDYLLATLRRLA